MCYHTLSITLTLCHGLSCIVTIRHTCNILLRYVRAMSSWIPLLKWTRIVARNNAFSAKSRTVTICHEWPHMALFLTLNTPVDIQSHVVTCFPSLFKPRISLLRVSRLHALSRFDTHCHVLCCAFDRWLERLSLFNI
jgi:hypothetical protein